MQPTITVPIYYVSGNPDEKLYSLIINVYFSLNK